MRLQDDNHVKIMFRFYNKVLEEETVETVWAITVSSDSNLYRLDSIPFYIPSIAVGDIFSAEYYEKEKMLVYQEIVEFSGNSTIQIVVMTKSVDTNQIRNLFKNLGCTSEKLHERYFSMLSPFSINYRTIKEKLEDLKRKEIIDYAESCLADGHRQSIDDSSK